MRKVKLGDVCESCLGKMLDGKKNKGEYYPYLANINVRWGSFELSDLPKMKFEPHEHERYGIKKGDLIICEGGEPGRCAVWEEEIPNMKIQKALHRVRPLACLNVYYLYYWFVVSNTQDTLKRNFIQTTIKHLTGVQLKELELNLPNVDRQEKIVAVLQSFDKKIACNNRINAELEAMAKTLYDYWFVQFDFPNKDGKPYKSSGGTMHYNEELKKDTPEGWGCTTVENILDKQPKAAKVKNKDILQSGYFFVIDQGKDLISGYTDDDSIVITPAPAHIVFGDHTRALKLINFPYARGADGTQILVSNTPKMPSYLLYQALSNIDLSNYGYARHFKFLKETRIVLPLEDTAQKYQNIVFPIYEKIKKNIFENQELAKLRDWLLPMLMNGQVSLSF